VSNCVVRPRSPQFYGQTSILKLVAQMLRRRWEAPSVDRLSGHVLRDAGLERIGERVKARR